MGDVLRFPGRLLEPVVTNAPWRIVLMKSLLVLKLARASRAIQSRVKGIRSVERVLHTSASKVEAPMAATQTHLAGPSVAVITFVLSAVTPEHALKNDNSQPQSRNYCNNTIIKDLHIIL